MKRYCSKCKWLYSWPEHYYSSKFIGEGHHAEKWSEKLFFPPWAMCQHPSCFKREQGCPKIRVKGQHQLNKNRDCPFFKKKWYLFWKRI